MKALGLAISSLFACYAQGQIAFSGQVKAGFLIPHHATLRAQMNHTQTIEIKALWNLDSSHVAYKNLNKPNFGLLLGVIRNNLTEINGLAYYTGVIAQKNLQYSSKQRTSVSFAAGVGYLTRRFDETNNRLNTAIGSHVNGLMQVGFQHYRKIGAKTQVFATLDLTHFSNGNSRMPNLGFNFPQIGFGVNQNIGHYKLSPISYPSRNSKLSWEGGLRLGQRQIAIDYRTNIVIGIAELNLLYPQSPIARWKAGVNIFYDRSYVHTDLMPLPKNSPLAKTMEIALLAGHEYRIGRIGFATEAGVYLYRPSKKKRVYYEALGLRYYVKPNLYFGTRIKAHLTSADYFEFGMGYQFLSKKDVKPGFSNGWRWFFNKLGF